MCIVAGRIVGVNLCMDREPKEKSDQQSQLASNLRFGWTTGTCATAAVNAAYIAMVTGSCPAEVSVVTPSGKQADLVIHAHTNDAASGRFVASVIKDAGDDPDVTHGAEIVAMVCRGQPGSGVTFYGGEGVGVVTKPGLPIAVGEPAINPVPRQMMQDMVTALSAKLDGPTDVMIEISVPTGAALASKTWNPRLGIEGGISILGTTGVVRPFSCSAWIASIHRGIDVARANALPHVIGSTGATSEAYGKTLYGLPDIALLDMGDFVGGMLKYMRRNPVPNLSILGGFGKLTKMAQGAIDLHSARSQVDFDQLAQMAAPLGFDPVAVAGANTVLEVAQMATLDGRTALANMVAKAAHDTAIDLLRDAPVQVEIIVMSRDGVPLGRAGADMTALRNRS